MNSKTKILAILLVSVSFCELNIVNASIFDKIMQKVEKAKDTATAVRNRALLAKDTIMAMKKDVMSAKDAFAHEIKNNLSGLSANAREAISKAKEIAGTTRKIKDEVSEMAKQSIFGDKKGDKTSDVKSIKNEQNEQEEQKKIATTSQQRTEGKNLVSSENSEENEAEETVAPDPDELAYSEEVIAKIDKLLPAKNVIEMLKCISFAGQTIADDDVPYLLERLKKFATEGIKKVLLSFSKSSLSLTAAMQILEGLKSHPQFISGLTFSGNALGDNGAVSVASNLDKFPMAKYLFFSDMGITGDGAVAILSTISEMSKKSDDGTSIQLIDLSHNNISDECLDTLLKCWGEIKNNKEMVLMLHGNPLKNTSSIDIPNNIKLVLK